MPLTTKQKSELDVAVARKTSGTASATDLKNLDYATKTFGYSSPSTPTPPSGAGATPSSKTVSVEKYTTTNAPANSTLSGIAKANATTVEDLMKANPNIKNPNLIYPGQQINLPGAAGGGAGSDVPDYSGVNNISDANKTINENQQQDAADATESDEPTTRKTTEDIMKEITSSVAPEKEKPVADFTSTLENYRSEYGVLDLENQLNDLRAQEQELLATRQTRTNAERGKTVATNVIEGKVSQVERQENERIVAVQNQITNATNQLNTKYNVINTLMKTKELDYNSAVSSYDKEMSNNISMYNAAKGIEEDQKSDEERQIDNARSNAQIALNALTASGTTFADLSPDEQTNLTKLSVQSGLGANFFSSVLKVSSGKDILTTITSADDTKATIIYKDGTTKTISTGLPARATSNSGGLTKSELKQAEMDSDRQVIMADVGKITGEDQKVTPEKMRALRQDIALNTPELLTWFDNAYEPSEMLNPEYYPLAVDKNQWLSE